MIGMITSPYLTKKSVGRSEEFIQGDSHALSIYKKLGRVDIM